MYNLKLSTSIKSIQTFVEQSFPDLEIHSIRLSWGSGNFYMDLVCPGAWYSVSNTDIIAHTTRLKFDIQYTFNWTLSDEEYFNCAVLHDIPTSFNKETMEGVSTFMYNCIKEIAEENPRKCSITIK